MGAGPELQSGSEKKVRVVQVDNRGLSTPVHACNRSPSFNLRTVFVFLHRIEHAFYMLQQYGGWNKQYQHRSDTLGCDMKFSVFTPPASESKKVPVSCFVMLLNRRFVHCKWAGHHRFFTS